MVHKFLALFFYSPHLQQIILNICTLQEDLFLRWPRQAVNVIMSGHPSVCLSVICPSFSHLNRARSAYSTWLARGQHGHATRPAYISVRVLRGRTYLLEFIFIFIHDKG